MPKPAKGFWEQVDKSGDCWLWLGAKDEDGYGSFYQNYHNHRAHRMAYKLTYGSIPDGMLILHKCNNPPCVNPAHLEAGTNSDNMLHCIRSGRHVWQVYPELAQRGERSTQAKLKIDQVNTIRKLYAQGGYSHRKLGSMFGVSHTVIQRIIIGEDWASVPIGKEKDHE